MLKSNKLQYSKTNNKWPKQLDCNPYLNKMYQLQVSQAIKFSKGNRPDQGRKQT